MAEAAFDKIKAGLDDAKAYLDRLRDQRKDLADAPAEKKCHVLTEKQ
jgi:hypothetical protein